MYTHYGHIHEHSARTWLGNTAGTWTLILAWTDLDMDIDLNTYKDIGHGYGHGHGHERGNEHGHKHGH
jgi:hypothetical protein